MARRYNRRFVRLADRLRVGSAAQAVDAQLIALVKPSFELRASSMVVDGEAIEKAVAAAVAATESCGWSVRETTALVSGAGGAPEVFIYGTRQAVRP